eukprot:jgi/Picre1/30429/NNA_005793.t1
MVWRLSRVLFCWSQVIALVCHGSGTFAAASFRKVKSGLLDLVQTRGDSVSLEREMDVKYSIGFLPAGRRGEGGEDTIRMTLHNGTVYRCRGRYIESDSGAVHVTEDAGEQIRSALESLGDWCAYRIDGWWTYELCYRQGIRQFHTDTETSKVTSEFLLGKYPETLDAPTIVEGDEGDASQHNYASDVCGEGHVCDVGDRLGAKREVEVRYWCGTSKKPIVVDVREPKSCHYVFDVQTAAICNLPGMERDVAVPARQIECWQQ